MGITRENHAQGTWIDHDYYLHVSSKPVVIEAGSRQRALPCIVCATPCGSQKCYLLCLVAGVLCPNDERHLNAAGLFCHVRCMPVRRNTMIRAVISALKIHDK